MPYTIVKQDNQYCVYKKGSDDQPTGKSLGCHDSRQKASDQIGAIRANENKEREGVMDEQTEKETDEKSYMGYVPYGVTSFEELDAVEEAHEASMEVRKVAMQFNRLNDNVLDEMIYAEDDETPIESRVDMAESKLVNLVKGLASRVRSVFTSERGEMEDKENCDCETHIEKSADDGFWVWKEKSGRMAWAATYSNNFKDRDNPPEIISEQSHKLFEKSVDSGELPPPELWFWHVKEWKFGEATWVAYDDAGFAMAGGLIDEGKEWFAKAITEIPLLVSHGMPTQSIERDTANKSIIVKHITSEISPLPADRAANVLTGWMLLKEDKMPVDPEKRQRLLETGVIDPEKLDALEQSNLDREQKGIDAKLERKEAEAAPAVVEAETEEGSADEPDTVQDAEAEAEVPGNEVEETEVAEEPETDKAITPQLTVEEVTKAITQIVKPLVERMETLESTVKALNESDDAKIENRVKSIPAASTAALIAGGVLSAINSEKTVVDGRTSLAKSAPKETEVKEEFAPGTGLIPFTREWYRQDATRQAD